MPRISSSPTRPRRTAIIKQLQGGADFATLAKEKSTDPSAKTNGGDLGFFKRDAMVPEFAEAAFTIAPGSIGTTPVKSQFGWHVIRSSTAATSRASRRRSPSCASRWHTRS